MQDADGRHLVEVLPVDCEDTMTTSDASANPAGETPEWLRPGWDGPPVEKRSADAGPEWPADAVERVTFTREAWAHEGYPERLPQTLYFGADGWPLMIPSHLKPRLDPRCKAELYRWPWLVRPEQWSDRSLLSAFRDFDRLMRWKVMSTLVRTDLEPALRGLAPH